VMGEDDGFTGGFQFLNAVLQKALEGEF
jgi:hypothetical protein